MKRRMENLIKEIRRLFSKFKRKLTRRNLIVFFIILIFSQCFLPWLLINFGGITRPSIREDFTTFILYRIFFIVIVKIFVKILAKILNKYLK